MTLIIGIDPSSKHLAAVAGDSTTKTLKVWKHMLVLKKTDTFSPMTCLRALDAMEGICDELDRMHVPGTQKLAFIESPLVGRGGVKSTMVQAMPSGAMQAMLLRYEWDVAIVNVSRWKAQVCGKGSATKDDVQRVVRTTMPKVANLVGSDVDLNDAAGIYAYGLAVATRGAAIAAGGAL